MDSSCSYLFVYLHVKVCIPAFVCVCVCVCVSAWQIEFLLTWCLMLFGIPLLWSLWHLPTTLTTQLPHVTQSCDIISQNSQLHINGKKKKKSQLKAQRVRHASNLRWLHFEDESTETHRGARQFVILQQKGDQNSALWFPLAPF